MAKSKSAFFCTNCGASSPKWVGKCASCGEWNTYVEQVVEKEERPSRSSSQKSKNPRPQALFDIEADTEQRLATGDPELDRVLGGGIVPGSLILIGGEPGIGKSTLMLQVGLQMAHVKVLYISGEESEHQIRMRAERLRYRSENLWVLAETATQNIFKQIELLEPDLVVVDSIQTLYSAFVESAPGSVSQVRECTAELMRFAKESGTAVWLVGHITKEGMLAGPKVLEHMVDTVLQFEGDRHMSYRVLRTTKNRFGSTSELGMYEMRQDGLQIVPNPSELLITQRESPISGVVIGSTLEGSRPLMIEIQSLVSVANYGTPQRTGTGFDAKRMNMLLAVLEKRCGFKFGTQDVFLNIAGGLKVEDPALDLPVCMALVSSFDELIIPDKICFAGEIGLGGEIRAVQRLDVRLAEAEKLGFKEMIVSKYNLKGIDTKRFKIRISMAGSINEVIERFAG